MQRLGVLCPLQKKKWKRERERVGKRNKRKKGKMNKEEKMQRNRFQRTPLCLRLYVLRTPVPGPINKVLLLN